VEQRTGAAAAGGFGVAADGEQRMGTQTGDRFGVAADAKGDQTTLNLSLLAAIDYRELSNAGRLSAFASENLIEIISARKP
jgi:hypothetical protein